MIAATDLPTLATIAVCALVVGLIVGAVIVLARLRPRALVADPETEAVLVDLRAAVDDLNVATSRANTAVDRLEGRS